MNVAVSPMQSISTTSLACLIPSPEAVACLPETTARRLRVVPLVYQDTGTTATFQVACHSRERESVLERLPRQLPPGIAVRCLVAEPSALLPALDRCYKPIPNGEELLSVCQSLDGITQISATQPDYLVQLVDAILLHACRRKASDIHVSPEEGRVRIRFRIDGVLSTFNVLHAAVDVGLLVRIKVLSALDIAETRKPQDGQFSQWVDGHTVDFRVSTFPITKGESLVLRVLTRHSHLESLASLGLPHSIHAHLARDIHQPQGLMIVCGPTGSGKSTTLHALLNELDSEALNIMSLEDPVELRRPGMVQCSIDASRGFGYAVALRALLRQDPDVLMVGEIRDGESGAIALRSAMTGHRVLTTVHANSVTGAIERLHELGVDSATLAKHLVFVASQRLIRKTCPHCAAVDSSCSVCLGSGYAGRQLLLEYLGIDETVRQLLIASAPAEQIMASAVNNGFVSLAQQAEALVSAGESDHTEVNRVLGRNDTAAHTDNLPAKGGAPSAVKVDPDGGREGPAASTRRTSAQAMAAVSGILFREE